MCFFSFKACKLDICLVVCDAEGNILHYRSKDNFEFRHFDYFPLIPFVTQFVYVNLLLYTTNVEQDIMYFGFL